jgi:hypothetical protein
MYVRLVLRGELCASAGQDGLPGLPGVGVVKFEAAEVFGLDVTREMVGHKIDIDLEVDKVLEQVSGALTDVVNVALNFETGRVDAAELAAMVRDHGGGGFTVVGETSEEARRAWKEAGLEFTPHLEPHVPAVRN